MDPKKEMVIIDDRIVTQDIAYCDFDTKRNVYKVRYKKGDKFYNFSIGRLILLTDPILLDLKDYDFYIDNELLQDIKEIYEFENYGSYYYHIILNNNNFVDSNGNRVKKISKKSSNVIEYMKKVSEITSLDTEDGKKLLYEQMKKVQIDDLNTALSNYLKLSGDLTKENHIETLIFPFGCNSSQYEAVENAIYNKISVIEGPPGTGKTQTILNIIANIVVRNMNCQVVSNNNTAIENIDEKLKKYDLDFFEALLGRRKNKDLFIEKQNGIVPKFVEYENININNIENILKNNNQIVREFYNTKKEIANLVQKKSELELEYKYFNALC